jgi:hypothetical protein
MSNGALRDAAHRPPGCSLLSKRHTVSRHTCTCNCMYVRNSSTALPAAFFTISHSVNNNTCRSLVQNFTLIGQYNSFMPFIKNGFPYTTDIHETQNCPTVLREDFRPRMPKSRPINTQSVGRHSLTSRSTESQSLCQFSRNSHLLGNFLRTAIPNFIKI